MSPFEQFRALIEQRLPDSLPPATRALTLEINAWLVTVRVYMNGPIAEAPYDDIEAMFESLLSHLPQREHVPWQLALEFVRQDGPDRLEVYGTPIWAAPGTRFASIDLQPVK